MDDQRTRAISLKDVASLPSETRVIVVGDAAMNPREVNKDTLGKLRKAFRYAVWLNPITHSDWERYESIIMIRRIFEMYPLTVSGVSKAVEYLT